MTRIKRFLSAAAIAMIGAVGFMTAEVAVSPSKANACDVQMGRPNSCHQGYMDSCRQLGANNPYCLNGGNGGRQMVRRPAPHYYGQQRPMPRPYYAQQRRPYYGGAPAMVGGAGAVSAAGAYQYRMIERAGGSTAQRSGQAPIPSPEQVAQQVPHKTTLVRVPCIDGYVQNEATGQCDMVRWVPGPPVE